MINQGDWHKKDLLIICLREAEESPQGFLIQSSQLTLNLFLSEYAYYSTQQFKNHFTRMESYTIGI